MIVANEVTDGARAFRYSRAMTEAPRFRTKPTSPMNQWVRDALEQYGKSMSAVADEMNRAGLNTKYDRSKIQKMTVSRRVTYEEAAALSEITGFPMIKNDDVAGLIEGYQGLDDENKAFVRDLVARLHRQASAG